MTRRVLWAVFAVALGVGIGTTTPTGVRADDEKKAGSETEKEKAEKPDDAPKTTTAPVEAGPKFPGYIHVATVHAEVVRASDSSVTIRTFYLAPKTTKGRNTQSRPHIYSSNGHTMIHPSNRRNPGTKVVHHDYTLDFHPEGLVRIKTLPKKTDADGKKVDYTTKELQDLKEPAGFPSYMGSKADLVPGAIVDAYVIRDRTIPAAKVTQADMKIKWIKVTGMDPNAAKNLADVKPAKKKNN